MTVEEKYKEMPKGMVLIQPTGSGKTRVALKSTRGEPSTVVGTASLKGNFDKEERKAFNTTSSRTIDTYSGVAIGHQLPGGKNLVVDESHNVRNPQTKSYKKLSDQRKKYNKALLMTATPVVNEPYDIVPQVNLVANRKILPQARKDFYREYYTDKKVSPGLWGRLTGVKPGSERVLSNKGKLLDVTEPYVLVNDNKDFSRLMPNIKREVVKVPMSKEQLKYYKFIEGGVPRSIRHKIKRGLPPSKSEVSNLNSYLQGLRQVSNTTRPYKSSPNHQPSPKVSKIIEDLNKERKSGGKNILYSNFLDAGIIPVKERLDSKNILYSFLTGSMSKAEREKTVNKYNSDKSKIFLMTGAGAEGLNLPGTTLVQLMEPHWNSVRLHQAAARGVRRGDNPGRVVDIKTYVSVFPEGKFKLLRKKQTSADEYLINLSSKKKQEAKDLIDSLPQHYGGEDL